MVTKIDGIEIGARNLLLNSSFSDNAKGWSVNSAISINNKIPIFTGNYVAEIKTEGASSHKYVGMSHVVPLEKLVVGETYTYSFYVYKDSDVVMDSSCEVGLVMYKDGSATDWNSTYISFENNKWVRVTKTFKIRDGITYAVFRLNLVRNGHVYYSSPQLVKGNKATDWTPAPEDVDKEIADVITTTDTKISKAKSDIKIETDKIALNVSNLTTKTSTIETQLGDKATKAEVKTVSDKAASIEANLNGITQRVSSTESTISTHTTQIGTVDGKINTAKTDAINTAATDATNKANKAKTDAISTASADATTKANNALKDGKAYTDTGLKPVKDTLATHTTEISTTKQQVSTIETNLGSITSRVSTVENKTTTIDGKVTAQETRLQAAEQKITPGAIISTISSQLSSDGKIENSVMKFDKNGILISHTNVGTKTNMGADGFKILREEPNGEMTEIGSLAERSGLAILRADEVYATNVVGILRGKFGGWNTYYVNTATGVDDEEHGTQAKPFKTLQYAINRLPKMLIPNVTIYITGTIYQNIEIIGFQGAGWLELIFEPTCKIYGYITAKGCTCRLYLDGGRSSAWNATAAIIDISTTDNEIGAVFISECIWCRIQGFNIKSNKKSDCVYGWGSKIYSKWLDVSNSYIGLLASNGTSMYVEDCCGSNNNYGMEANNGGDIRAGANNNANYYVPKGTIHDARYDYGGRSWNTSNVLSWDSIWQPPPTPSTKIYESYYSATSTKSWRDNWGWRSDNNYIYQGQYGSNGNHRGFMYFDSAQIRSDLSGATIHAVELRLTRRGAGGSSAASSINLYGHAYDSSGGGYALGTDFGWPGAFAWGESKWISLPTDVGYQLKSGAAHGLAIIGGAYMIFEAYAELWIKYEK